MRGAISIHALREEGDAIIHTPYQAISSYFYPRPPRGGRQFSDLTFFTSSIFLSTPSARRATSCSLQIWLAPDNFYPRPPAVVPIEVLISIHALREEGDPDRPRPAGLYSAFLSTPSARRATVSSPFAPSFVRISIHALREEGDRVAYYLDMGLGKISIHALREEGDTGGTFAVIDPGVFLSTPSARRATILPSFPYAGIFAFLSTPSARRATKSLIGSNPNLIISIHALCEEGDLTFDAGGVALKAFLSTPSARRATRGLPLTDGQPEISIHALREEGDRPSAALCCRQANFYPRPPRGGRRTWTEMVDGIQKFLSTPSARRATRSIA